MRGNGDQGLASLKQRLDLVFEHHDAGDDARAAAEVVLRAEGVQPARMQPSFQTARTAIADDENFDVIEDHEGTVMVIREVPAAPLSLRDAIPRRCAGRHIGIPEITQGNIDNSHIYLRSFFDELPTHTIGESNRASAAARKIAVDWGVNTTAITDLDGAEKFFRKREWIREFFDRHAVRAGETVTFEEISPHSYRVAPQTRSK